MRTTHQMKKPERINLIPIMDAVFIFIFFLLMSAQFINVYEIGSSVPMVREVKAPPEKKDPLNLVLEVHANEVKVRHGKDGAQSRSFSDTQWTELRVYLGGLKTKHPDEKVAQVRPQGKVPFHRLVKVIDHARGEPKAKLKLFEEIVFDGRGAL